MMETQVHFTKLELKYIQFDINYVKSTLQFSEEEMMDGGYEGCTVPSFCTVLYCIVLYFTWPWRCRWWARGRARPRPRSRSCPGSAAAAPRTSGHAGRCFSPKYFCVVKQIFLDKNIRYFSSTCSFMGLMGAL